MGVTIFTSRIILESLGITDYGVFNVVGGIAFSFGFFSSSMSNATQRYFSYGHGEGNIEKVKEYFNLITTLYLIACGIVIIIGGGLGYWIVSKLNIPKDLFGAGLVVYYTTLVSLCITLFSSVFDSVLISRENLTLYAYLSIVEVILKLGIAYLIFLTPSYKLIYYSLMLMGVTIIIKSILMTYCLKKFEECKLQFLWSKEKIKGILSFMGWNGLGTVVWSINDQGTNILLNLFFGPVVNAARGVASQANNAINNFVSNFYVALSPQIIKNYASGDIKGSISLMNNSSLFSYFLLWLFALPVIIRRDYILHLWLKEVPEYTSIFLLWIIIYSLVNVLTRSQWVLIQAIGEMKKYIINGCLTMIGAIPIGYILFKFGFVPQSIIIVTAILRLIYVYVSLFTLRSYVEFNILQYCKEVSLPIILVTSLSYISVSTINNFIDESFLGLIFLSLSSIIITLIFISIVLKPDIRKNIIMRLKSLAFKR